MMGNPGDAVTTVELKNYPRWASGKVREIFDIGDELLFVATDRVSAFDVVLPTPIPGKGILLTDLSRFWFERTAHIVPNHVVGTDLSNLDLAPGERQMLDGRTMIVRKAERIDVECVVRAHITGSGWHEYVEHGTLAGVPLPDGLQEGDRLPALRFTPATKNDAGHDVNISVQDMETSLGRNLTQLLQVTSLAVFRHAESIAKQAGFTLADSKFEFGYVDNQLVLIDEVLTPDSSRYWRSTDIAQGSVPQGFDKQVVRNWLIESGWDREPPAPELPPEIVDAARSRYAEVLERLKAASTD